MSVEMNSMEDGSLSKENQGFPEGGTERRGEENGTGDALGEAGATSVAQVETLQLPRRDEPTGETVGNLVGQQSQENLSEEGGEDGSKRKANEQVAEDGEARMKRRRTRSLKLTFNDPAGEARIPLTTKTIKEEGYTFNSDPPVSTTPNETNSHNNYNSLNNLGPLSTTSNPNMPHRRQNNPRLPALSLPQLPIQSHVGPNAPFQSSSQGPMSVAQSFHNASRLPMNNSNVDRQVPTDPTPKKGIRKDIQKGAYRSRLRYTLLEKKLVLQQALMQYEKTTKLSEKREHFKSKRLVTKGKPSTEYVAGYNPKTAYGLLAVANLLLREGCCTMTQAVE